MPEISHDTNVPERLSRMEESQANFRSDLNSIKHTVEDIRKAIGASQKTNWGLIFGGVALMGSLWAAAIHPISQDQGRVEESAKAIALAVLEQNKRSDRQEIEIVKTEMQVAANKEKIDTVISVGSPELPLLKYRLQQLEAKLK
jgi:hypothetical protein